MTSLYLLIGSLLLLASFSVLIAVESWRGVRVLSGPRSALDEFVLRVQFIFAHVDLAAFLREESVRLAHQAGHDLAHGSLQGVRSVERFLTRIVRHLRAERAARLEPKETSREFVKTLSDFKGTLSTPNPDARESVESTHL